MKHKLLPFEGESRESNRGFLLLGGRGSFLEHLERFGASFEAVRSFAGKRRWATGRAFDGPFEALSGVLSACNRWHRDRLEEGFIEVWSENKSGRRPAKGSPEKMTRVRHTRWLHAQVREGPILGA